MVDTKSVEQTKKNWENAIGRVPAAYSDGVKAAQDWQGKAMAGESLYAAKVQEAISAQRRAKKISEVSNESWKSAAVGKGAARIGTGMSAAKDKFGSGIGKVLDTLHGVTLGARSADPMANVDNRVKPIVAALANMKK